MPFVRRVIAAVAIATMCAVVPSVCTRGPGAAIAEQMACCKGGHHACHKPESAADCCKQVAAASPMPVATAVDHVVLPAPANIAVVFVDEPSSTIGNDVAADSSKRPHDPPHLHAFALLI